MILIYNYNRFTGDVKVGRYAAGLINALTKILVVSHEAPRAEGARAEAKRSGVQKARNGTLLALRA